MLKTIFQSRRCRHIFLSLGVTLLSVVLFNAKIQANPIFWQANSVSEIKAKLAQNYDSVNHIYQIQYGDTINTISEALDTDGGQLVSDNHIQQADLIYAGKQLVITSPNSGYHPANSQLASQVAKDMSSAKLVSEFDGNPIEVIK